MSKDTLAGWRWWMSVPIRSEPSSKSHSNANLLLNRILVYAKADHLNLNKQYKQHKKLEKKTWSLKRITIVLRYDWPWLTQSNLLIMDNSQAGNSGRDECQQHQCRWLNSNNDLLVKVQLSTFLNQYSFHYLPPLRPLTPSVQLVRRCVMMYFCLCLRARVKECKYV